ncbi:flavonol 3-O-glucosyltransferase UGT89B1-like [Pistacia vera]|uniref:flavonol 3-O-glucosyltransferase UGT89B1-like n=1 Tax=Pistacia vera TaxID=55513 RepID=UPI0012634E83|nr:flavonol 3-O-glucosyltransferase UGT89B1-like [Pistacia vera]
MATTKPHILVYPFPTSGHIIPLLDLTHRLLTRGLSVTVLITPNNLSLLDPLLSCHQSLQPLIFPSPETPTTNGRFNLNTTQLHDLHYPLLLQWFRSQQSLPAVMVFDFFLGWTHQLASEVGVPSVLFSPSGAFGLSMFFTLWREQPKIEEPDNEKSLVTFPNLPNCPVFPWYQLPPLYTRTKEGEAIWEFRKNVWLGNMASWGIVLNTSTGLERVYIENIKKQVGHDRVWAVGPVLPQDGDMASRGGSSSVPCHDLMTWLDAREDGSVVYVCFGSRGVLTSKQMDTLASALEKSGVHFIWCVKKPDERHVSHDYGTIPNGFEDRTAGRGYIIKGWAPQVEILGHRSVGAFLTHCGWNSTLEGTAAGVVMLTWPMGAEQFMNARVLVEQLGVGIRVGEGTQNVPEPPELARVLSESVNGARAERIKAKEVREAVLKAVAKGGSSDKEMDEFVKQLNELERTAMAKTR